MPPYQSSFRRILLSRLLLLSVPVLLMGLYVTYRKARSAFLETARQNLTESAVRRGESIHQSIEALRATLVTASNTAVLKLYSPQDHQAFLEQLSNELPSQLQCIQLTDVQTGALTASTCGNQALTSLDANTLWSEQQKRLLTDPNEVNIKLRLSPDERSQFNSQLEILLSAPVYDLQGRLRHVLSVQAALIEREKVEPGSLEGSPVVINQEGTILAHPLPGRVGHNIDQEADSERLQSLMKGALAGRQDFLHLFSFEKDGVELVAGYTSIPSPVTDESVQKWVILAVTPIDNALAPLKELRQALFFVVLGLIAASGLATLYIARELARPLEKLRDYAIHTENLRFSEQIPQDFNIKEFNQLSLALKEMVERLKAWGEEIVSAWKEAQNANQLKNEFLATTSHELRTPLNGIIGCVRVVKDGYCDSQEEEREFLRQADEAAVHLLGIINDVLDISKIEAGKLSVQIEKVNLRKLLNEVIELQAIPIRKKGLQFETPKFQEEMIVYADPAKLKQVLINVVGNAVKFTESGRIAISIRTEKDEPKQLKELSALDGSDGNEHSGGSLKNLSEAEPLTYRHHRITFDAQPATLYTDQKVIVSVNDTGIGIDPSQQEKLFRPFVMVDGSTTRQFGGTGLGLAISKNLIELMGGNISLLSDGKGKGTTVEISLPLPKPFIASEAVQTANGHQVISE